MTRPVLTVSLTCGVTEVISSAISRTSLESSCASPACETCRRTRMRMALLRRIARALRLCTDFSSTMDLSAASTSSRWLLKAAICSGSPVIGCMASSSACRRFCIGSARSSTSTAFFDWKSAPICIRSAKASTSRRNCWAAAICCMPCTSMRVVMNWR
ncbi:hypothetical protein D3C76_648390 [compost metagenome]